MIFDIPGPRAYTYRGVQGLQRPRVQFDFLGDSRGIADELAEAAIVELAGPAIVGGIRFVRSFVAGDRSDSDRGASDAATADRALVFRRSIDLFVWYQHA